MKKYTETKKNKQTNKKKKRRRRKANAHACVVEYFSYLGLADVNVEEVAVVVHCCWCRVRMRFIEELFVARRSVEEEFDEWFRLFGGDKGEAMIFADRREETRVGTLSTLGELFGCWGDARLTRTHKAWKGIFNREGEIVYLLPQGRPRFPFTAGTGDDRAGGGGGSQAEHCQEPSGIDSRPAQ